jgi:hypothetical protein
MRQIVLSEGGELVAGRDEMLVHGSVGVDHAAGEVLGFELAIGAVEGDQLSG